MSLLDNAQLSKMEPICLRCGKTNTGVSFYKRRIWYLHFLCFVKHILNPGEMKRIQHGYDEYSKAMEGDER